MVDTKTALISSTITASLVTGSHAAAHYIFGNPESFGSAGVNAAGIAVFASTWILSYAGMQDLLPF